MGILKRGRYSLYHYTISGVAVLLSLLIAVIFSNTSYAAPGCADYTKQKECSSEAYWKDGKLMYGQDELTAAAPTGSYVREIESKKGGKYDFFKYDNANYIAIPANHNPGDKVDGAFLVHIKGVSQRNPTERATITYKDNISVHQNKQEYDRALDNHARQKRKEAEELEKKLDQEKEGCDRLRSQGNIDPATVSKCLSTIESLTKQIGTINAEARALEEKKEEADSTHSCNIGEGLGWLVCPASNFMALLTDGAFSFLSTLLRYETFADDKSREQLLQQWSVMRNIANFAFVIAFLVIVYSQLTSLGVSNYNIKRMIPRLIVGAILLNLSFLICGLLVDISNVAGAGLHGLIESITPTHSHGSYWGPIISGILAGGVGTAVVASGSGGLLLSFALPALITSLLAIITVLIILIARQAILTILIVISPLAFVMFLLPNTVKWFDRWRSIFTSMLLMYPVVAVIFAGSKFASAVVSLGNEGGVLNNAGLSVAALAIQAVPLFIVPVILKASGGVLQRLGILTNNKSKGLFDRARKSGDERISTFRNIKAAQWQDKAEKAMRTGEKRPRRSFWAGDIVRSKNRETTLKQSEDALNYQQAKYNATSLSDRGNALRAAAGNEQMATVIQAQASNALRKEDDKIIEAMGSNYESLQKDDLLNRIAELIKHGSSMQTHEMAALISTAIKTTDPHDYMPILEDVRKAGKSLTSRTAAAAAPSWALGAMQRTNLANGTMHSPINDEVAANVASGSISASIAAGLNKGEYAYLADMPTNNAGIQQEARSKVQSAANTVVNTPALANQLNKNREAVINYANMSFK